MRADWRRVAEAAFLIVVIRFAFHVASFAAIRRRLARLWTETRKGDARATDRQRAEEVAAAVRAAGRRLRGTTCLVEALAGELMLQRRGIRSTLHFGVRQPSASAPLDAHAWLECAGATVIGNQADLSEYRTLVTPS